MRHFFISLGLEVILLFTDNTTNPLQVVHLFGVFFAVSNDGFKPPNPLFYLPISRCDQEHLCVRCLVSQCNF